MEQLKPWDIWHIYTPHDELKHLKKAVILAVDGDIIFVETTTGLQSFFLEANEFVKSELYNNTKPMKPKTKPKATPKQVWRPLGEYEKVYKGDILKQVDPVNNTGLNEIAEVKDDATSWKYFNAVDKYWDTGEYQKKHFLIARPLEVSVQYLRSDWLLFTKDRIGNDDVKHLKNEHKRIGDLLSAHKKIFK